MKMTMRWYGKNEDSVTLEQIRQVPGRPGIITALHQIPAGEKWELEDILARKKEVEDAGLELVGIESVNIHEDIKIGKPSRDRYIENYIYTLKNLSKAGIHLVCYNFMPIFDWTRTDLAMPLEDSSTTMAYDEAIIGSTKPEDMFRLMEEKSSGFLLPGWEPNRRDEIMGLFADYADVTADKLRENYKYFLDAIMPTCEEYDVKMAVHPDDPSWSVFGLPRIVTCEADLLKICEMNPSKHNGFTLCTGSLGSNRNNNLPSIIRNPKIAERIHFAHIRNVKFESETRFHEVSHLSSDGSLDMFAIIKALFDMGFDGVIRPDHGRMIWGEQARPGYGLYDRALGCAYINGVWETLTKLKNA
jgi:mannonate dehydratase